MSDPLVQLDLPFDAPFSANERPELWTPRDIWVRLNQRTIPYFKEDRRIEYKTTPKIDWDDIASYYSAFSNTPDGGVICIGVSDSGNMVGCLNLSQKQLNKIENFHIQMCPQARPEIKRILIASPDSKEFLIAIFIPYIGKLIETNKGEAWIRFGDSKHKFTEEEKRDFRSTRNELSFELDLAPYEYPSDFRLDIIQDFCDAFRVREMRPEWSNEEILIDRHLLRDIDGSRRPLNSLVLMAARDPGKLIPGCRVRIQRFDGVKEGSGEGYSPIRDRFVEGNIVEIIKKSSEIIESILHDVRA